MVERFSDESLEDQVNNWICDYGTNNDNFMLSFDQVKDGKIYLEVDEKFITITTEEGIPSFISSKEKSSNFQNWIEKCNQILVEGQYKSLSTALIQVFDEYVLLKQNGMEQDSHMAYGEEDQVEDGWGDDGNQDMEDVDYVQIAKQQKLEEEQQNLKKLGIVAGSIPFNEVINLRSIQMLQTTRFYQQALEAVQYLYENEQLIKGWLNVVFIKEFLTIRIEIDLNYIDLSPSNIQLFGWVIEEPLIISLSVQENKLLNYDNRSTLSFEQMLHDGMFDISFTNNMKSDSYGCKDYIKHIVKNFKEMDYQVDQEESKESSLIVKVASAIKTMTQKKSTSWSKFFNNNVDDELLARLVEMGYDIKVGKKALKHSKNDLDKALDYIREKEHTEKFDSQSLSQDIISSKYLPQTENKIIQMMLYICDHLEKASKHCFVCLEPLLGDSIKLRTCNKDYCEYSFEESFGCSVYPELKYQTDVAHFDLSITAKAIFSTRCGQVVEPFPTFFLKGQQFRGKRGYLDEIQKAKQAGQDVGGAKKIDEKNKDILAMMEIFAKLKSPQDIVQNCTDEESLIKYLSDKNVLGSQQLGLKAYKLLAYIFATNRTTIRELKEQERLPIKPETFFKQYILTSSDPGKERIFMQAKKQYGSFYCWHGSSTENWYSILRNGLRNLSNSQLMTAGAAYGQGIYASSNFYTSQGYSFRYSAGGKTWIKSNLANTYIIGIVEIINKKEYKKDDGCNICVISREEDIILRYLLVFGHEVTQLVDANTLKIDFEDHYNSYLIRLNKLLEKERKERIEKTYHKYQQRITQQIIQQLAIENKIKERQANEDGQKLDKDLENMMAKVQGRGSAMANNRIMKEYKCLLQAEDFKNIMTINFVKDNMYTWKVKFDLNKYETNQELKDDINELIKQGQSSEIEYEVIFNDDYPISPPFFRVVFPRFRYQTGRVTVGGSICMESLTPTGWSSARSIESYFVEVLSLLNEGKARIDFLNRNPYTLFEAKDAFQRVARQHGWIK